MPWVDDVLDGLQIQIDKLWYDLLHLLALAGWTLQKGLFMMGHAIELANIWLVENAFAPLIAQTNNQMQVTVSMSFVIALIVLGITYLLAAFVRLDVVRPRSAIGWYLAGIVFFQLGPMLYQGMHEFRRDLSTGFYAAALSSMQSGSGPFNSLNNVSSSDLPPLEACDALGPYLPTATGFSGDVDGLDIALAYLRADGQDVMGYPPPTLTTCTQFRGALYDPDLPADWQFHDYSYFYNIHGSEFFSALSAEDRKASIDRAGAAQFRIFSAWALVIFGVIEQLIFLLLTIAEGLTFVSFSVALLFACFRKTEVIARSILDMWIELIVQTVLIALMQSLIVSFLLGAAATQNALVVLGVSLLCTIFIFVLLWSGIKAVWNSFNRLFGAIGQATGGVMVAPGTMAVGTAAAGAAVATGGAVLAANVGSSAMAGAAAMNRGATASQTAGVMLGGSRGLQSAARTLAYLPGTRNTDLGRMADEFTEGAVLRQVGQSLPAVGGVAGPVIGAHLLSDRSQPAKRKRGMTLPAEPVDLVDEEVTALDQPTRPRRTGTFTPLAEPVPQPVTIRPPGVTQGDPGEEIEERVNDVSASVQSQAGQTRAAVDRVQHAAGSQSEEVEEQVSEVGAAVRTQAGQTRIDAERVAYADDMHGEEVEDRITTLGATLQTGQTQPVRGVMQVEGADNVAGVMGDFVAQTRVQRTLDDQPMTDGADHFSVAQGIARAMGVTPEPDDRVPVQGDVTRLGLFGDQALRLGLNGQQAQTVISEVKNSPTGELSAPTRSALVEQTRGTLNTGWEGAERAVNALQQAAAMLPNAISARGTVAVPAINLQPQVQVTVDTPDRDGLDQAMLSQAALAGSQAANTQGASS